MTDRDSRGKFLKKTVEEENGFLQRPPSLLHLIVLFVVLLIFISAPVERGRRYACTTICRHDDFPLNYTPENSNGHDGNGGKENSGSTQTSTPTPTPAHDKKI